MMVRLRKDDLVGEYGNLPNDRCELQITSFLAHVWNEIEHDTVYKNFNGNLSGLERDAIDSLGHLTKTGDTIIKGLISARDNRESRENENIKESNERFYEADKLLIFLQQHYGVKINNKKIDFFVGSKELLECLIAVNWNHPTKIVKIFSPKFLTEARRQTLKLQRFLEKRGSRKPKIDADTCDMFTVGICIEILADLEIALEDRHGSNREKLIVNALKDMNS